MKNILQQLPKWSGRMATAVLMAAALVVLILSGPQRAETTAAPLTTTPFYALDGALAPGEFIVGQYPLFTSQRDFNFAATISGGGPVALEIRDSANTLLWQGDAQNGETVWGSGLLTSGVNSFRLENLGGSSANFDLKLYNLPTAPYVWDGAADPIGENSQIRVRFAQSGLYTFDLDAADGRYQFHVNENYIQKTVEADTAVAYFIPAGTHTLTLMQDSGAGADWQVAVSNVGAAHDSLPYHKSGGEIGGAGNDFSEEWLPIELAAAAPVNIELSLDGSPGDGLTLVAYSGATGNAELITLDPILAGETVWATVNLPAGVSRFYLQAAGGNADPLSYDLTVRAVPTAAYTWSGSANADGLHSQARVSFAASGLYTFELGAANGRYQFLINENFIQKTVEEDTAVTYFIPAGMHTLTLAQDSGQGADWEVAISAVGAAGDSLPYHKSGGAIGGAGNDFSEEWLPIYLANGRPVNLVISVEGDPGDELSLEVYNAGGGAAIFTLDRALGTETVWANFSLSAGINRLRLIGNGDNDDPLNYDLTISELPITNFEWDGRSLQAGLNSEAMINFAASGLYRFEISSELGFANLELDGATLLNSVASPDGLHTSYDLAVSAGNQVVRVAQDTTYPATEWSAAVTLVTADSEFFTFTGLLAPGESVTPLFPLPSGEREFNFVLSSAGGPIDLTISDGDDAPVWDGTILDGETTWGTGAFTAGNNAINIVNQGADPAEVSLTFYHLPLAAYGWEGAANAAGLNSHIRVIFAASGLYDFSLGAADGRYQLVVNEDYIRKTAETDLTVTYYIPAGVHDFYIEQDTGAGAEWSIAIANVGAAADSLPYHKMGGDIGGAGNDFTTEWLPIYLNAPTAVNLAVSLTGSPGDNAALELYSVGNLLSPLLELPILYADETVWATVDLPAGISLIRLAADSPANSDPLAYHLTIDALPAAPYLWTGQANAAGLNSAARLVFNASGLYTFDLGVADGRYQLHVNEEYIQKTAETDDAVTYYIPAGTHLFQLVQDSGLGADWEIGVLAVQAAADSLPYHKLGGELGGAGNDFSEEWLPIFTGIAAPVNLQITVTGGLADAFHLHIYDMDDDLLAEFAPIYGSETVWGSFDLPADGARLYLVAHEDNDEPLAYELTIDNLAQPIYSWSGRSLGVNDLNSVFRLDTPISGLYQVQVNIPQGFVNVDVDIANGVTALTGIAPQATEGIYYEFELPLPTGIHTFTTLQQSQFAVSEWAITVTLLLADAPSLTAISPNTGDNDVATAVTITGANFMPGVVVHLALDGESYALTDLVVAAGQITAVVPAGLEAGLYDLIVTNPDEQTGLLADAFTVTTPPPITEYFLYLPIILKP